MPALRYYGQYAFARMDLAMCEFCGDHKQKPCITIGYTSTALGLGICIGHWEMLKAQFHEWACREALEPLSECVS